MRTLMVGPCAPDRVYQLVDPDAPSEVEFESYVVKALTCLYPKYRCLLFGGTFQLDDKFHRPDLALVARDFSHWFIIEVELVSHSLERHVLPQVRAFRYGRALDDATAALSKGLSVSRAQARTLLDHVPRTVAVVANRREPRWEIALAAHDIQMVTVSSFVSSTGVEAFEIEGALTVTKESLGFGQFLATDRSVKFGAELSVPLGIVQIIDPAGTLGTWTVVIEAGITWLTKDVGTPNIAHGTYLQLLRTVDGRLTFRSFS